MRMQLGWRLAPVLLVVLVAAAVPTELRAAGKTVLVVSEESAKEAVPRSNPIFGDALVAAAGGLLAKGLTPKADQEVLPKGSFNLRGRNRLSTWMKAVEKADPPVDAMVALTVIASVVSRSTSQVLEVRVTATGYALPEGKDLGGFAMDKPKRFPLPADCDKRCVIGETSKAVKGLGREAGLAVAEKLTAVLK